MLIGVGFVAILTGSLAQRFIEPAVVEMEEAEEEMARSEQGLLVRVRDISSPLDRLERALAGRGSSSL